MHFQCFIINHFQEPCQPAGILPTYFWWRNFNAFHHNIIFPPEFFAQTVSTIYLALNCILLCDVFLVPDWTHRSQDDVMGGNGFDSRLTWNRIWVLTREWVTGVTSDSSFICRRDIKDILQVRKYPTQWTHMSVWWKLFSPPVGVSPQQDCTFLEVEIWMFCCLVSLTKSWT